MAEPDKPHWSKMLRAFINGSSTGFARLELVRLDLIKMCAPGPKYCLTTRGKLRAEKFGWLREKKPNAD